MPYVLMYKTVLNLIIIHPCYYANSRKAMWQESRFFSNRKPPCRHYQKWGFLKQKKSVSRLPCHRNCSVLVHLGHGCELYLVFGNNCIGRRSPLVCCTDCRHRTLVFWLHWMNIALFCSFLSTLREVVVPIVSLCSRLGIQDDTFPSQGILKGITEPGKCHEGTCNAKVCNTRAISAHGRHPARG